MAMFNFIHPARFLHTEEAAKKINSETLKNVGANAMPVVGTNIYKIHTSVEDV
jgi:hypothetical protein